MCIRDRLERETIQKRVTDAYYSRSQRGFKMGGKAPYGFHTEPIKMDGINTVSYTHLCCNYEDGNCMLLDDGDTHTCPQTISFSVCCKWFRWAVLPLAGTLEAEIYRGRDRCV